MSLQVYGSSGVRLFRAFQRQSNSRKKTQTFFIGVSVLSVGEERRGVLTGRSPLKLRVVVGRKAGRPAGGFQQVQQGGEGLGLGEVLHSQGRDRDRAVSASPRGHGSWGGMGVTCPGSALGVRALAAAAEGWAVAMLKGNLQPPQSSP